MTQLNHYMQDGANHQARAVLAFVQSLADDLCYKHSYYLQVARWENGREQGYVIKATNHKRVQLNIAFFEYRNSDFIHFLKWEQKTFNSPTLQDCIDSGVYENKYDNQYSVEYGQIVDAAKWVVTQLTIHMHVDKE